MSNRYYLESIVHCLRAIPRFEQVLRDALCEVDSPAGNLLHIFQNIPLMETLKTSVSKSNIHSFRGLLDSFEKNTVMLPWQTNQSNSYYYVNYALQSSIQNIPPHIRPSVASLLSGYEYLLDEIIGIQANMLNTQFTAVIKCDSTCNKCGKYTKNSTANFFRWIDVNRPTLIFSEDCTKCKLIKAITQKTIIYYPPILIVSLIHGPVATDTITQLQTKNLLTFVHGDISIVYTLSAVLIDLQNGSFAAAVNYAGRWYVFEALV